MKAYMQSNNTASAFLTLALHGGEWVTYVVIGVTGWRGRVEDRVG
jgi:hypothetical protein